MQALRDQAAEAPCDLAFVPFAAESRALAIRSDRLDVAVAQVRSQVAAHRWHQRRKREGDARRVVELTKKEGVAICKDVISALPSLAADSRQLMTRPTQPRPGVDPCD